MKCFIQLWEHCVAGINVKTDERKEGKNHVYLKWKENYHENDFIFQCFPRQIWLPVPFTLIVVSTPKPTALQFLEMICWGQKQLETLAQFIADGCAEQAVWIEDTSENPRNILLF